MIARAFRKLLKFVKAFKDYTSSIFICNYLKSKNQKKVYMKVYNSEKYFHFIYENLLPLFCLLRDSNLLGSAPIIVCNKKNCFDRLFGLFTPNRILYCSQDYFPEGDVLKLDANTKRLYFYSVEKGVDFSFSESCSRDLAEFRDYVLENLSSTIKQKKYIVIVKRKRTVRRIINHNDLLLEVEKKYGHLFDVLEVDFEELCFEDQVKLMRNTSVLIAAHGAGLANMLFLNSDAKVIEVTPSGWHFPVLSKIGKLLGLDYQISKAKCDGNLFSDKETSNERRVDSKILTEQDPKIQSDVKLRVYMRDQVIFADVKSILAVIDSMLFR